MPDTTTFHHHLTDTENALAVRKRQRIELDREIEGLEQIVRIYTKSTVRCSATTSAA